MTVRTPRRRARLRSAVSIRYSDSGVVMRMWGASRRMAARAAGVVSPVRRAVLIAGVGWPRARAASAMPASGSSRLRWMSEESAFSGET